MRTKNLKPGTQNPKCNTGVTLIEMAVVIALILIMVSIGTVVWNSMSERSLRNSVVYSTRDLVTALKMYRTDHGDYPLAEACCNALLSHPPGELALPYTNVTTLKKDYLALTLIKTGNAVCLQGQIKNISNKYFVALCPETDDAGSAEYQTANQPACCWTKGGLDCSSAANWYKCATKM